MAARIAVARPAIDRLERELAAAKGEARHAQMACRELLDEAEQARARERRMVQRIQELRNGLQTQS